MVRYKKYHKTCLLVFMLCLFAAVASASPYFHSLSFDTPPTANESFTIDIQTNNSISDPLLRYSALEEETWQECSLSTGCDLSLPQGQYEYYFVNGTGESPRFPTEGAFVMSVSKHIDSYYNHGEQFASTDPLNENFGASCFPWQNDFSCAYESYQANMIEGMGLIAAYSDEGVYESKWYNLTTSQYDEGTFAVCDAAENDFSCDKNVSDDDPGIIEDIPTSTERQAGLISALATSGIYLSNGTARNLAESYMEGSARNCDIWASEYDCDTSTDQARMTLAAWTAYQMSGNTTFRDKAKELSEQAYSYAQTGNTSTLLGAALWRSARLTGDTKFKDAAKNISKTYDECISNKCSPLKTLSFFQMAREGYKSTGGNYYQYAMHELLENGYNSACDPKNDTYACSHADEQGAATYTYMLGYQTLPDEDLQFERPRLIGEKQTGENLTFAIDIEGNPTNATLQVRPVGFEWTNCTIDRKTRQCTVSQDAFIQQGPYDYRFISEDVDFPDNGTFRFALGERDEELRAHAENISTTAPSGYPCDPWSGDYNCYAAQQQGWYITGLVSSYEESQNTTYLKQASKFANASIDPSNVQGLVCDHGRGDYDCENQPATQGTLMRAMWSVYRYNSSQIFLDHAEQYTTGDPSTCNVWQGDYDCETAVGQAMMIDGFLNGYVATGNRTYLHHAEELADVSVNGFDPAYARSLWRISSINDNVITPSHNDLLTKSDECTAGNCTPFNYSQTASAGLNGFIYEDNSTLFDTSFDLVRNNISGESCNPWNGSYECVEANAQGSLMRTFWNSYTAAQVDLNGEITLDLSENTIEPGNSIDIDCDVENTVVGGTDLVDTNISLSSDTIEFETSHFKVVENISPEQSVNLNATIPIDSTGTHEITCSAQSENGWGDTSSVSVSVEAPDDGGNNDGGNNNDNSEPDGSSGPITPLPPDPETERVQYNFTGEQIEDLETRISQRPTFQDSLAAILDTQDPQEAINFTREHEACFEAIRRYQALEDEYANTTLTLRYTCAEFLERLVILDTIPTEYASYSSFDTITDDLSKLVLSTNPTDIVYTKRNVTQDNIINITYHTSENGNFSFDRPLILMKNHTLSAPEEIPSPNITLPNLSTNISSSYQEIAIESSRATQCSLNINGFTVQSDFSPPLNYNGTFDEGWNTITVLCEGDEEKQAIATHRVYRRQMTEPGQVDFFPLYLLIGFIFTVGIVFGIKRYSGVVITPAKQKIQRKRLQRRLRKMQNKFHEDNFDEVIAQYNKVKQLYQELHGEPPNVSFWNSYLGDIGLAMRVYLLLDFAVYQLERGRTETVTDTLSNLQRLYNRMQDDDNIENVEKVKGKAKELDKLLRMEGESFSY